MMRRAVTLVCLLLASVAFADAFVTSPSAEELAECGTPTRLTDGGQGWVYTDHQCLQTIGGTDGGWRYFAYELHVGGSAYRVSRLPGGASCSGASTSSFQYSWQDVVSLEATYDGRVATYCEVPASLVPPEVPVEHGGWTCPEEVFAYGATVCYRENSDGTYDGNYSTPCGGADSSFGMTFAEWEAWMDAAADAVLAECDDPVAVMPPDDPAVACTGTDGIACESTLQDIRHLLSIIVNRETSTDPAPDMPEVETDPVQVTVPNFDRSQPSWDEWVAPDASDAFLEDAQTRISQALATLKATAETRFPFGLGSWVPLLSVPAAPACVEMQFHVFGSTSDIGWCGSAVENVLATTLRAALLVVALIGFSFAVLRTVAWA